MEFHGPLLGYQRRSLPIGEIRMGYSVEIPGRKGRQPMRSDTWRLTTASELAANVAAEKLDGSIAPWERRKGRFEVITSRRALDVFVPPRDEAVSTSMVLFDGPRRRRECNGKMMSFPDRGPCICPLPADPDDPDQVADARAERERLAGLKTPQACRLLTRYSLTIPELPGALGIWRLNTGSVNAAVESADSGEAMSIARAGGAYLRAVLYMDWRPRGDGSLAQVPVLMLGSSAQELADQALPAGPSGLLTQLKGPAAVKAIEAPSPDVRRPGPASAHTPTPGSADPAGPVHHTAAELAEDEAKYQRAQAIADECAGPVTSARFTELWQQARGEGVADESVYVTEDRLAGPCLLLEDRLAALWEAAATSRRAAQRQGAA